MSKNLPTPTAITRRPNLYEIGVEGREIEALLIEGMGELSPELEQRLSELLGSGSDKVDAAAWVLKRLKDHQELCKATAKSYTERGKMFEAEHDRLKGLMKFAIENGFSGKLKTALHTYSITKGRESTTIQIDLSFYTQDVLRLMFSADSPIVKEVVTYAVDTEKVLEMFDAEKNLLLEAQNEVETEEEKAQVCIPSLIPQGIVVEEKRGESFLTIR